MDLDIDPDDKRMVMLKKLMYMLGRRVDRLMANMNASDPKQHIPFPNQTQNLPLQDMYNEHDDRENNQEDFLNMMKR